MDTHAFVVMERGSRWPQHVDRRAAGCVAVKQAQDEVPGDLLRRARDRVQAIERTGQPVELAILSCNDDPTDGALEVRVPIARALFAAVLRANGGRLVLAARPDAPAGLKRELFGLAEALIEGLAGSTASVSVSFA